MIREPGTSIRRCAAGLAMALGLAAVSCTPTASDAPAKDAGKPIEQVARLGPVTATVRLERSNLSLDDLIPLTVSAEAVDGIDVRMPDLVKTPGRFAVQDQDRVGPVRVADGRRRWTDRYKLDVYVSGEYTVPALEVRFCDRRTKRATSGATTQPGDPWRVLRTKALVFQVAGLKIDEKDLTRIRDIAGPVELPVPRRSWAWLYLALGGLWLGVLALLWWRTRRRPVGPRVPTEPAHVKAFRHLQAIAAMDLVANGEVEQFYVLVSGVMRTYIEDRFGLRAPERTTAEFLAELSDSDALADEHKQRLKGFLEHCDLVKFARLTPVDAEIQGMFDAVRTFIESTREETARVPVEAGA